MIERSKDPTTCTDREGFVSGMTTVVESAVKRGEHGFSLGDVKIGKILLSVMSLCQHHSVLVDDTMAQLVSSIALLVRVLLLLLLLLLSFLSLSSVLFPHFLISLF